MNGEVHIDDLRQTLSLIAQGDRIAYASIYTKYMPSLLKFVLPFVHHHKEEAHEVLQEVFLKVWIHRSKLTEIACFESYVYRMTKNLLYDRFKAQKSRQRMLAGMPQKDWETSSVHDAVVYQEYVESAHKLIDQLSPQRQKIFKMRTQKEMAIDEIADALNISRSAVKKQLYESIKMIKSGLSHEHGLSIGWLIYFLFH